MCGGKVGQVADSVGSKVSDGLSNIDPTTKDGLINLATGGVGGGMLGLSTLSGGLLGGDKPKQDETAAEKTNAAIAAEKYNLARDLDFVRDEYKSRVDQLDSDSARGAAVGRANIGAQASGGLVVNQAKASMRSRGVGPDSGAGLAGLDSIAMATGEASGRAGAESAFAVDTIAGHHKQNVIAQAIGDQSVAVAGLSDIAHRANAQAASSAQAAHNSRAATMSAIGTGAGLALSSPASKWKNDKGGEQQ
ncbi:MAG: hypothetical protein K6L60_05570 [Oceanobacter sp.]